jgi:nitroreductase
MDTFEAIETRRAVKHFDPQHRLSEGERERLLSLALLSPTAFNIQHWRLVLVDDAGLRTRIRAAAWDQAQVTDASLLIVLCADTKAWQKDPARYWRNAPGPVQDFMVPAIRQYYEGHEQVQRDEALRSSGIIAQTLMLGARAMGYDSCPMDGFDFNAVGELIALPPDHLIAMMIAIGKATEPARPRGGQLPLEEIVVRNRFSR